VFTVLLYIVVGQYRDRFDDIDWVFYKPVDVRYLQDQWAIRFHSDEKNEKIDIPIIQRFDLNQFAFTSYHVGFHWGNQFIGDAAEMPRIPKIDYKIIIPAGLQPFLG
jgi:hypothetical protein